VQSMVVPEGWRERRLRELLREGMRKASVSSSLAPAVHGQRRHGGRAGISVFHEGRVQRSWCRCARARMTGREFTQSSTPGSCLFSLRGTSKGLRF
jgi:hypothetical protein